MTLPRLLVIGAMKAGTTSVHADLGLHPSAELAEKEFGGLLRLDMSRDSGRSAYRRQWVGDRELTVDVSATYAMHPHYPGVPETASRVAPEAKILYLVRNPFDRIVSHYLHDSASGVIRCDLDTAVSTEPRLLDYTRYGLQLRQWLNHFPQSSVRVVRFDDYVARRRAVLDGVLSWLGVDPLPLVVDLSEIHNARDSRRVARGLSYRALSSKLWVEHARPHLPQSLRRRVAGAVLPQGHGGSPQLSEGARARILDVLQPDLAEIAKFTDGTATWDLEGDQAVKGGSHQPERRQ